VRRLLPFALTLLGAAVLSLPATFSAAPAASATAASHGAKKREPKCHARNGKAASKRAEGCKKEKRRKKKRRHPAGKDKTTKPGTGTTTNPAPDSGSSKPMMTASAVSLTAQERALFEAVNKERTEHALAALSTSSQLQPISEARAKQTAEEYAAKGASSIDDVRVAIEDAGYCVTSQREIESGGESRAVKEEEERRLREYKEHGPLAAGFAPAFAALADSAETTEEQEIEAEERIPIEPQWTLLGVGVAEAGTVAVELEDFVEPC